MNINKKEGPRVNVSILLRKGNEIITGGKGRNNLDGRGDMEEKRGWVQVWEETEEKTIGQENE